MVILIFRQQGANEPVDAQRLTSSSARFVIQGQGVRWQAEIPYGRLHLSSTKANEFDGIRMMLVIRF